MRRTGGVGGGARLHGDVDLDGPTDQAEGIATIHAALDAGVTLLDTRRPLLDGDCEMLVRDALAGRDRDAVRISVKFGALRDPAGAWAGPDGRPMAGRNRSAPLRRATAVKAARLGLAAPSAVIGPPGRNGLSWRLNQTTTGIRGDRTTGSAKIWRRNAA